MKLYINNTWKKDMNKSKNRKLNEGYNKNSIKNNINVTNKVLNNNVVIEACKLADIYDDIKSFEGNIEYMIGNGGNNLSGGQKQRIAIARTLLVYNKFIIFDDSL